ncbi:hypothetical protein CRUP_003756 [Coryphaenoides rupestris]|nr:hypothetical protein CRUP_003756 [Coryphaenoides rupestris]
MEMGSLQAQLQQQACREGELTRKLQEEQFCLLQCAVVEAEGIILDAMAKIDDPIHVRCTSSPDYLVSRAEVTLGSIDKMQQSQLFLKELKLQSTLARADPAAMRYTVQRILSLGQAIHMLVTASTDLQKDIVESGRGAASADEFYAKNSCWTEGLISASKAVGWGATQILESADRVVSHNGKYEEIIACSHEIAASTAQLVASSKVKADRSNKKLITLQQASRHVNDMTAVVVTSTKHGQLQITDQTPMDFSGRSLIKLKKMEMESQVKVLELESQLEQERVRLGELRKKHYDIGGVAQCQGAQEAGDGEESFPPPPPPNLLPEASYSQTQPYPSTTTTSNTSSSTTSTQGFNSSNPFLQPQTQTSSPPQPLPSSSAATSPAPFSTAQSYTPAPQPYTSGQPFTSAQTYTPYTPSTQPYTPSTQLYTPSTQPYTPSIQPYTPSAQPYLPSQSYTPTLNPTQSTAKPYFPSSLPVPVSNFPATLSPASKAKTPPQVSPAPSRRANIFTKSGNLLKNAFKKNDGGNGES